LIESDSGGETNQSLNEVVRPHYPVAELFRRLVRPKLRPLGLLAASFTVTALVSAFLSSYMGNSGREALLSLATGVTGKAISLVVIIAAAHTDFGLSKLLPGKAKWWVIPVGGVIGGGLFVLEMTLDSSLPSFLSSLSGAAGLGAPNAGLIVIFAFLLAVSGILEEILFRGVIQSSCEKHFNPFPALLVTAVLFAVPHLAFGWVAVSELFIVGFVFSWYRREAGSLVLPMVIHACHNLLYGLALGFSL